MDDTFPLINSEKGCKYLVPMQQTPFKDIVHVHSHVDIAFATSNQAFLKLHACTLQQLVITSLLLPVAR
jgi:hypothetical protein